MIAVPAMLIGGLAWDWKLLLWFFPVEDPPVGGLWTEALSATWYLRDFLWLILFPDHPGPRGLDLNDDPLGNALWSAAFIRAQRAGADGLSLARAVAGGDHPRGGGRRLECHTRGPGWLS